ncbi:MAG: AlpA family transcriptional regulator [Magnetococcales bacterium]|nr:AlpA family transcriptional regulator [Magnetococcales bacterium]
MPEVKKTVSVSTATIYRLIEGQGFPKPVPIGGRSVAWLRHEVEAWIQSRIALRG